MKTRMSIIEDFIAALRRIDGGSNPWNRNYSFNYDLHSDVYYGYNDNRNSFPQIEIIIEDESIYSIGGGVRFSNLQLQLRCYSYDEDTQFSAEALVQDVESVIDSYRSWAPHIEDIRIAQIETDGGINAPYGVAFITAQVLFKR